MASYGNQLGTILDALETRSQATGKSLPKVDALFKGVRAVKAYSKDVLHAHARATLNRLRNVDEVGGRTLTTEPKKEG
ncbi:MAG: hypothetical protein AAFY39_11840 [Pseudomonadota bacterium]